MDFTAFQAFSRKGRHIFSHRDTICCLDFWKVLFLATRSPVRLLCYVTTRRLDTHSFLHTSSSTTPRLHALTTPRLPNSTPTVHRKPTLSTCLQRLHASPIPTSSRKPNFKAATPPPNPIQTNSNHPPGTVTAHARRHCATPSTYQRLGTGFWGRF